MAAKADLKTTISADMTGFSATMRRAGGLAATTGAKIGKSIGGAGRAIGRLTVSAGQASLAIAAAGTAAAGAFGAGLKGAADLGGKLSDLSARTGIAAGDLAKLGRAFEDNGVSADKIGSVINKLQKTISDFGAGSKTAAKPFESLGISFDEISRLDPGAQFELIQTKISAIQDPAQRAAVAMQLFGKSGGELLTLFADSEAFANAGAFLGTQAEILNRSSGVFDSISDKLARIPAKLQGFFVGFLEPIAGDIDAALIKFESFDFAALGLRIGSAFNMKNLIAMFSASVPLIVAVLGDAFAKALGLLGALLRALFSPEGLSFMKNILIDVLVAGVDAIGGAFYELAKSFGKALKGEVTMIDTSRIIGKAKPEEKAAPDFASRLQEEISEINWAPSSAVKNATNKFKAAFGNIFPDVAPKQGPVSDIYDAEREQQRPVSDIYDAEREQQRRRVAAEMKAQKEIDAKAATEAKAKKSDSGVLELFGPPKELRSSRTGRLFGESVRPSNRLFGDAANPAGRAFGEAARASNRAFGKMGMPLGGGNIFERDRARLGLEDGLTTGSLQTGSLGEKRRLNTSANDRERKKALSLQEQQAASLQNIESNIKSAIYVN